LWAITSFFNPAGYNTRLRNYRTFRAALNVPLLTVELGRGGVFELAPDDADIMVRVDDGDVLWQKERLLNIAIGRLPDHVGYVAWLDSDILFAEPDWHSRARARLSSAKLVQPFAEGVDLDRGDPTEIAELGARQPSGYSFAFKYRENGHSPDIISHVQDPATARHTMPGFAWVARRELIAATGFYDAAAVGGGDGILAEAACGWFDHAARFRHMTPQMARHFNAWAKRFHQLAGGRMDYVPGRLYHLWHGAVEDRKYRERHAEFQGLGFDPASDLVLGRDGAWKWAPERTDLQTWAAGYFAHRREDGS